MSHLSVIRCDIFIVMMVCDFDSSPGVSYSLVGLTENLNQRILSLSVCLFTPVLCGAVTI